MNQKELDLCEETGRNPSLSAMLWISQYPMQSPRNPILMQSPMQFVSCRTVVVVCMYVCLFIV